MSKNREAFTNKPGANRVAEMATMYRANIRALVLAVGGEPGNCRGCRAPIYWVPTKTGKTAPYNLDGLSHFADCPKSDRFRKPKGTAAVVENRASPSG